MAIAAEAESAVAFDRLDLQTVRQLVARALSAHFAENHPFIEGDHWQDGAGWIGPAPDKNEEDYDSTIRLIRKGFTSRNVLLEIVKRRTRGVVGREPRFGVAPLASETTGAAGALTAEQEREREEIEGALTRWWDAQSAHLAVQKAADLASWAERGVLRVYIPAGRVEAGADGRGVVETRASLSEALDLIHVEAVEPDMAAVIVDADTEERCGVLITKSSAGRTRVELSYLGEPDSDGIRETVVRVLEDGTDQTDDRFSFDLGGRLLMAEIASSLMVTEQQREMQRALNLALTMIPHNIVTGGFLERTILNGLPPGHFVEATGSDGRKVKRFVREPYVTGPGQTSWVRGLEVPQKDGTVQLTDPTISYRDPTDPKFASDARRAIYQDMLEAADQAHVLISGDATPSGKSREEARSDFALSLHELETPANAAGRWLVETVLALAEVLMGQPRRYLDNWRGLFECSIHTGPISVEERTQNTAEVEAGLLSSETAMERNGIADVQAEMSRVLEEPHHQLAEIERRSAIVQQLANAGADIVGAGRVAGIPNPARLLPPDLHDDDLDDDDDETES